MPQRGGRQARPYLPGTGERIQCTFRSPAAASVYTALIEDRALVADICAGIRAPQKAEKARNALREALRPLATALGLVGGAAPSKGAALAASGSSANPADGRRWSEVASAYLAKVRITARAQGTPDRYANDLRRISEALPAVLGEADPPISAIRPSHFAQFHDWLRRKAPRRDPNGKPNGKRGYHPNTTGQIIKAASRVLTFGCAERYLDRNPWRDLSRHDRRTYGGDDATVVSSKHPFSYAEAATILAACSGPRDAIWPLLLFGGLRVGEALGLRWSDLDLRTGRLELHWQAPPRAGKPGAHDREGVEWLPVDLGRGKTYVLLPPKHRSRRVLYLPERCLGFLRALPSPIRSDTFIFAGSSGAPLNRTTILDRFTAFRRRAGLGAGHSPKDLRDTAKRLLAAANVQSWVITSIMGHSDATTERDLGLRRSSAVTASYGGACPDELLRAAASALDDLDLERLSGVAQGGSR